MAAVLATEVHTQGVTVYKVLAGAEATFASYNDECMAAHATYVDDSLPRQEWRGLYTQFQGEHVLGTVPYRWEAASEARLVAVTFDELDVVVVDGPMMHDGSISGGVKALAVKELLGLEATVPLVASLGEQRKAVLVRETEDEWELVLPHALLATLRFTERGVACFRRHPSLPVTQGWRPEEVEAWQRWRDEEPPACAPDLDLSWLPSPSAA